MWPLTDCPAPVIDLHHVERPGEHQYVHKCAKQRDRPVETAALATYCQKLFSSRVCKFIVHIVPVERACAPYKVWKLFSKSVWNLFYICHIIWLCCDAGWEVSQRLLSDPRKRDPRRQLELNW